MTTVYVSRAWLAGGKVYHTDRACPSAQNAADVREVELEKLGGQFRECKKCSDATTVHREPDPHRLTRLLEKTDPDDVGPTPEANI